MNTTPVPQPPRAVAVEGLCCSGKTTLVTALAERLGAHTAPDYADLAPLPPFPPADRAAARTALRGFLALEAGRAAAARASGRSLALYDRSPLTLIAHEHAMAALGVPADPYTAAAWFTHAALTGACQTPDTYVYLHVSDTVFTARHRRRGRLPDHLIHPTVRARITDAYTAYFTAVSPRRLLILDATSPLPALVDLAAAFLNTPPGRGEQPPPWTVPASALHAGASA